MRALRRIFLCLLCVAISSGSFAAAAPQTAAGGGSDMDRAAIEKAVQNYMDSWNKHDVKAVAMTYT